MKNLIYPLFCILFFTACGQNTETPTEAAAPVSNDQLKSEIAALEAKLLETGDATKNMDTAAELVEKSQAFAEANPDAEETPEMLFKAADVANGMKNYGKAIQLWGAVWRKHPDHPRAPMALFLQGFTFDSKMDQGNMARKYYTEFLKQYPESELTEQVKQLLSVVNTSADDLVKQYEEKGN